MGGTKVAYPRRVAEGFFDSFLTGKGIDIGHGGDPVTTNCTLWDTAEGDATLLQGLEDESFDWVYSSHCLEHLDDCSLALVNWWRVLKTGGFLVVAVPDFQLYEHGIWPSRFNSNHKTQWSVEKLRVEFSKLPGARMVYCRLVDTNYNYSPDATNLDQSGDAEVIVEGVLQKCH